MELVLSAISAGGLVGAGDQYLCLVIIAIGSRADLIKLSPQVQFMESWWFIAIAVIFWLLTIAPAYASLLSPGVMNAVNTITNFLSGFLVPVSGALLALASVGIIAEMHPDLQNLLNSLRIFGESGEGIGALGLLTAGGGAVAATTLNGARFLAKPALSTASGTAGTLSAPIYATVENITSVVLMGLLYLLININPWLLVALLALVTAVILGLLGFGVYQLWRMGKGIGRLIRMIEEWPKAGLSVVAEFLVWGSGWMIWKNWKRGTVRLVLWILWLATVIFLFPALATAVTGAAAIIPPLIPILSMLSLMIEIGLILGGLYAGSRSARSLMRGLERMPRRQQAPAPIYHRPPTY
jgi:hypothetical protein